MFCKNCGKELSEGDAFCKNCGEPVDYNLSQSTTTNPDANTAQSEQYETSQEASAQQTESKTEATQSEISQEESVQAENVQQLIEQEMETSNAHQTPEQNVTVKPKKIKKCLEAKKLQ